MRRLRILTLLLPALLVACGDGPEAGQPSREAREILQRVQKAFQAGTYVGLDGPIRKLCELGEGDAAIPLVLEIVRSGDEMAAAQALHLVRDLGPQVRGIAGPLASEIPVDHGFFWRPDEVVSAIAYVRPRPEDLLDPIRACLEAEDAEVRTAGASLVSLAGPGAAPLVKELVEVFRRDGDRSMALALAAVGTEDATRGLVACLAETGAAWAAMQGLAAFAPEAQVAFPEVLARLGKPDLLPSACEFLVQLPERSGESVPALLAALDLPLRPLDRWPLLDTLGRLATPGDDQVRDRLLVELAPGAANRGKAARALARVSPADPVVHRALLERMKQAGEDRFDDEMHAALGALEGDASAFDTALLDAAVAGRGEVVVSALAALHDPKALDEAAFRGPLSSWMNNRSLRVAASAAAFLLRRGDVETADPVLAKCLLDWKASFVARDAMRRAHAAGPRCREVLLGFLSLEHHNENASAALLLADLGIDDEPVIARLRAGREVSEPGYRLACARALHRLRGKAEAEAALAVALDVLETTPVTREQVRRGAATALVEEHAGNPKAEAALASAEADPDPGVRHIAKRR